MSRWAMRTAAALLLAVGAVWIAQGVGVLPGSFMTGRLEWAGYGALSAAAGIALLWLGMRGGKP